MSAYVQAGDWPQILGPRRNGVAIDERIAGAWPSSGLKTLWQREVGRGFAGVAVSRGDRHPFSPGRRSGSRRGPRGCHRKDHLEIRVSRQLCPDLLR